jgi:hypothetical protein
LKPCLARTVAMLGPIPGMSVISVFIVVFRLCHQGRFSFLLTGL